MAPVFAHRNRLLEDNSMCANTTEGYECDVCGRELATFQGLGTHYSTLHDDPTQIEAILIGDLRRVANELEKTPIQTEYSEHGDHSVRSCQTYFGSWNNALEEAGLGTVREMDIPDSKLLEEIRRLCDEIGYVPGPKKMQSDGKYSDVVYYDRFGSWPNAVKEAGLEPVFALSGRDHPLWKGGKAGYGPNWAQQRRKARERDDRTCKICGMGEEQLGQCPDVHHITPARKFMESGEIDYESANDLDNLICLCRSCHSKWEGIPVLPQASD